MQEKDFDSLRNLFIKIDVNGNGQINANELRNYLKDNTDSVMVQNLGPEIIDKILSVVDQN
jgi:Ca2+-binding EF-hand superfamily protein